MPCTSIIYIYILKTVSSHKIVINEVRNLGEQKTLRLAKFNGEVPSKLHQFYAHWSMRYKWGKYFFKGFDFVSCIALFHHH